jgi:hypothetical protein
MRMLEETASPRGSGREEGWLRCATPLATSSPGLGHAARRSGCGPQQRSSIIDDDSLLRGRAPWIRDAVVLITRASGPCCRGPPGRARSRSITLDTALAYWLGVGTRSIASLRNTRYV